jgi:hypothetical protein
VVLVTNESPPIVGLAPLYRDRADCENVFDEIKNQWGWAGFVTRDLKRCQILARLIALLARGEGKGRLKAIVVRSRRRHRSPEGVG